MDPESHPSITYGLLALTAVLYLWRWLKPSKSQLSHIPTLGPSAPILSYWGAILGVWDRKMYMIEAYSRFKGRAFKVAKFSRWDVVVTGTKLIDEFKAAPDDVLSFTAATDQLFAMKWSLGYNIAHNVYQAKLIRTRLTKSLHDLFPDIRDELIVSSDMQLKGSETDWVPVVAWDMVLHSVARTSNRVFVGFPLCRNPDYIKFMCQFPITLIVASMIINIFPDFLKPIAVTYITGVPSVVQQCVDWLQPEIEARLQNIERHGQDYPGKPLDLLSWLMDEAEGEERSVRNLSLRILVSNFGAIHTSTVTGTYMLFQLAANPECVEVLRQEVETVTEREGWTKAALGKMYKVDSFIKECVRFHSLGFIGMFRKAVKDFTFSDGTHIPAGTMLGAPLMAIFHDPDLYEDPEVFNPWRFSDARAKDNDSAKYSMVNASPEFLPFGYGRHACPGRFFAVNELGMLLVHLITKYDIRMENGGGIPPPKVFGNNIIPNWNAKVVFRERQIQLH